MKNQVIFRLSGLLLLIFAVSLQAQQTETITEDAYYFLPNSTERVKFLADTEVELNAEGRVTKGVLAKDTYLHLPGSKNLCEFALGTYVTFNDEGEVTEGTLAKETELEIPATALDVFFEGNTEVTFNEKGRVVNGTIADDYDFRVPPNGDLRQFLKGTFLHFTPEGYAEQ